MNENLFDNQKLDIHNLKNIVVVLTEYNRLNYSEHLVASQ